MSSKPYARYRIAIVGSCQATGLRLWLERLLPGALVSSWHVGVSPETSVEAILPILPGTDLIITQVPEGFAERRLDRAALSRYTANVVFLPMFVFAGFHPDLIFREYDRGNFLPSPVGTMHSALVIAAFQLGIAVERVESLFNALVFGTSGYFDVFDDGRAGMFSIFREHGYDLEPLFGQWVRDGAFMYTDNHPHIRVIGDLARLVVKRAGLEMAVVSDAPQDHLGDFAAHWPIHRPVARRVGIAQQPLFLRSTYELRDGEAREVSLSDFVYGSYRIYAEHGDLNYVPHIRTELTRDALRDLLRLPA